MPRHAMGGLLALEGFAVVVCQEDPGQAAL